MQERGGTSGKPCFLGQAVLGVLRNLWVTTREDGEAHPRGRRGLGRDRVWPWGWDPDSPGSVFLHQSLLKPLQGRHLPLGTGNLRWAPGWELRLVGFSWNVSLLFFDGIQDHTTARPGQGCQHGLRLQGRAGLIPPPTWSL